MQPLVFALALVYDCLFVQVLERYPPNSNLPCENVADYCFPQGVQASPMDMRSSQSGLHKVGGLVCFER